MKKSVCFAFVLFLTFALYSESSEAVPYGKDEFPHWIVNLRRTEIITLGSFPFVTLATTLGYSLFRYYDHGFSSEYAPNPFAKTSKAANLDTDEQKRIIAASGVISLSIGLTDLFYNMALNNSRKKGQKITAASNPISISFDGEPERGRTEPDMQNAYLYGGMESVVF
ncbi:hypothetical protein HRI96_06245 [Treponema parvum]|uniref:DUF5683 domain-containing protein n=1 Tax=Treponema parvum TaxID=138851 RepID=A0A975ID70_9SPIR|nr:hypothetical protein [Treponema parvum]QTQ11834.1 hypothetical protein HRI96_06245 [Treponema parvum]